MPGVKPRTGKKWLPIYMLILLKHAHLFLKKKKKEASGKKMKLLCWMRKSSKNS